MCAGFLDAYSNFHNILILEGVEGVKNNKMDKRSFIFLKDFQKLDRAEWFGVKNHPKYIKSTF